MFYWGAAVVLVVSFVALAVLWPKPRMQEGVRERRLLAVPAPLLEPLCGGLGIAIFVAVVYAGFAGSLARRAEDAPCPRWRILASRPALALLGALLVLAVEHAAPREAWDAIADGYDRHVAPQEEELANEALAGAATPAGRTTSLPTFVHNERSAPTTGAA